MAHGCMCFTRSGVTPGLGVSHSHAFGLPQQFLLIKNDVRAPPFKGPPFASQGLGAASGHDRHVHDPTTLRDVCVLPQTIVPYGVPSLTEMGLWGQYLLTIIYIFIR